MLNAKALPKKKLQTKRLNIPWHNAIRASGRSWWSGLRIGMLAAMLLPGGLAVAQQVVADGTSIPAPAGAYSTTANSQPVFYALNNGSIAAAGSVNLTSSGSGSPAASVETGGSIVLNGGSTMTYHAPSLQADGVGSSITSAGVSVGTDGGGLDGVLSQNNAAIMLHGGTVEPTNGMVINWSLHTLGSGINRGDGAAITGDLGLAINPTGIGAYAQGGTIRLDTVTISEQSGFGGGAGLRTDFISVAPPAAPVPPGLIGANNVAITVLGDASLGAVSTAGGQIVWTHGSVSTAGSGGFGLHASQFWPPDPTLRSEIDATDVTVTTTGVAGHGAYAYNGALINLTDVGIQTSGQYGYGLQCNGWLYSNPTPNVTELNATRVTAQTSGDSAWGVVNSETCLLDLTDSAIHASGAGAGGVFVGDTGSVGTLLRTIVTSDALDGLRVARSGHLLATGSAVTAGRYGARSDSGESGDPNILSLSGGSLTAASDAIHADDTMAQITLQNGTSVSTGSGNLLNVVSTDPLTMVSEVDFNVLSITAAGHIIADAASTANVFLKNNSAITGIEQNTFATVDGTSTWTMNGNSNIHALTLAGKVVYTAPSGSPAAYKTLTTANYTGQSGTITLNTYLGDDSAPSDLLVIDGGAASGTTSLDIKNFGGPGALTTGNGILVVQAIHGATTAANAFKLAGPTGTVVAGGFEYKLYRGSGSDNNWYLRSIVARNFPPGGGAAIPALNPAALALLALALAAAAFRRGRRQRA